MAALVGRGGRGSLARELARCCRRRFCSKPPAAQGEAKPPKLEPLTSKADLEGAKQAEEAARFATSFMFPWERRALDDTSKGLSNVEKAYWIVFSGCMAYFGFKMLTNKQQQGDEAEAEREERERIERFKKARALAIVQGDSIIGGDEDPFEGLTPEEIEAYVKETSGWVAPQKAQSLAFLPKLDEEDEFEGMSPEEINRAIEKKAAASHPS